MTETILTIIAASIGGSYVLGVGVYLKLCDKIDKVSLTVNNHQRHELDDIQSRLGRLEQNAWSA